MRRGARLLHPSTSVSVCRPFRLAVPHQVAHGAVSTPRSSNRTCRATASGSRTRPHACKFARNSAPLFSRPIVPPSKAACQLPFLCAGVGWEGRAGDDWRGPYRRDPAGLFRTASADQGDRAQAAPHRSAAAAPRFDEGCAPRRRRGRRGEGRPANRPRLRRGSNKGTAARISACAQGLLEGFSI